MSDEIQTINPDQVAVVPAVAEGGFVFVQASGGPIQKVPFSTLLSKLIAAGLVKIDAASLQADLAHAENVVALVFNDPTVLNNGWWRKVGASGAGNWVQFEQTAKAVRESIIGSVGDASKAVALATGYSTWAELAAFAFDPVDGDRTWVADSDTGTHAMHAGDIGFSGNPVDAGGQTPNGGRYEFTGGVPIRIGNTDAQSATRQADRAEIAVEGVTTDLVGFADQIYFGHTDVELYPAGHSLVLDRDGRVAGHSRLLTPSEMELWGARDVLVDAGGGVVWRSDAEASLRAQIEPTEMELWKDSRVIVDPWGGVAERSEPFADDAAPYDVAKTSETAAFFAKPIIAGVGHSMIDYGQALVVAAYLQQKTGQVVGSYKFGMSGNTARGIAARLNAYYPELAPDYPTYLPAGGSVPANGTVTLISAFASPDPGPWEMVKGATPTIVAAPGSYAGIAGTFDFDAANGMRFTRAAAGSALALDYPQPLVLNVRDNEQGPHVADYRQTVWMIWAGRNSITDTERSLGSVRALVRHLTTMNKAFVVLPDFPQESETIGTPGRTNLAVWNASLKAEFGDYYCYDPFSGLDLLDWAIANGPNATDRAAGLVSREWRGDQLHLNNTGMQAISPFIGDFIVRRNFLRF